MVSENIRVQHTGRPINHIRSQAKPLLCALIMALACGLTLSARADDAAAARDDSDWAYLQNDSLRIGVKKSMGACIGFLSSGPDNPNLLNHADQGRFVQQSYYGDEDGSKWLGNPWSYNPVQGGDSHGQNSNLEEFRATATELYARVTPRNWGGGQALPEVSMEEWISLKGKVAHVRFRMTYNGDKTHGNHAQEIPAIFVQPQLSTLVTYEGDKPWTGQPLKRVQPGWPNQGQKMTENWVAYVDAQDSGIGAYIPIAVEATCYRFPADGSDCAYVAPVTYFSLTPKKVFEYDLYLTLGTSKQIRARFDALRRERNAPKHK